jgi:hypothetical protein
VKYLATQGEIVSIQRLNNRAELFAESDPDHAATLLAATGELERAVANGTIGDLLDEPELILPSADISDQLNQ